MTTILSEALKTERGKVMVRFGPRINVCTMERVYPADRAKSTKLRAAEADRMSPGYSFQARGVGRRQRAVEFGFRRLGGDWLEEGGSSAQGWERFIDTSAYYIMIKNNGYDFNADTVVPEPASAALFVLGGGLFWQKKRRVL